MYKELGRLVACALLLLLLAVMPTEASSFRLMWTQEATIADILAAFKAKELTCRQLVQMYLDRIEAYERAQRSTPSSWSTPTPRRLPMRSMQNSASLGSPVRCIACR
jgi:hypothetical protein